MKSRILAVGKPSLSWAADGVADYSRRLRRYGGVETEWIKARDGKEAGRKQWQRSEGWLRVLLDERGECLSTRQWVNRWRGWTQAGANGVCFWIGAADGHEAEYRDQADEVLAIGSLTLQHELALVVLLEQIYRVQTVIAGSPYHRD